MRVIDESGAVLVIVMLSLLALLGMTMLVVDVGGLLVKRRSMVRAADAAALAAAQDCATAKSVAIAEAAADQYANANESAVTSAGGITAAPDCGVASGVEGARDVAVEYSTDQETFFAPILGLPEEVAINGKAIAEWGAAGGGRIIPLEMTADASNQIPCQINPGSSTCAYWFDNGSTGTNTSSSWGFINFNRWDVEPSASCPSGSNSPATRQSWITGGVELYISEPPTYACVDSGFASNTWFDTLKAQEGTMKDFPVNDPDQMITTPGREKYAIIGFARFNLVAVHRGNEPGITSSDPAPVECSITVNFTGPNDTEDISGLVTSCEFSNGGTASAPVLTKGRTTYATPDDYTYDATTRTVTWKRSLERNVKIAVTVDPPATTGVCGFPPSSTSLANAVCVILEFPGVRVGGSRPGGGVDFGLRAIRLRA